MTSTNISDAERREVAARLRKAIGLTEFAEALGFDWTDDSDWVWNDVSNLVADLIEPSCDASATRDVSQCRRSDVDRDALLALADEMEEFGNLPVKHPGIRVLHNDDFSRELGYARRIREACGEEGA